MVDPVDPKDRAVRSEPRNGGIRLTLLIGALVSFGLIGGLSGLVVVLSIVAMLALHELGHFLVARWAGMQVTEFFVGFGPRLWSVRRGETTYGVRAIPAGAYVRITGMSSLDVVDPADEPRTYRQQS
ncbi:MAG: site-2 protease family protein, partial [Actinomycetota bacterium]|nr:site-2 protease family protein [Actinomycetota bacterium]